MKFLDWKSFLAKTTIKNIQHVSLLTKGFLSMAKNQMFM